MRFGVRPECQATVSVTGVLIKVHAAAWLSHSLVLSVRRMTGLIVCGRVCSQSGPPRPGRWPVDRKVRGEGVIKPSEGHIFKAFGDELCEERGAIDTPENFARFYMHLILERAVGASKAWLLD